LADAVYRWALPTGMLEQQDIRARMRAGSISRSVAAAARFLGADAIGCVPATKPLSAGEIVLGQAVKVLLRGWETGWGGWVASETEPMQVIVADHLHRFRKVETYADCLLGVERTRTEVQKMFPPRPVTDEVSIERSGR